MDDDETSSSNFSSFFISSTMMNTSDLPPPPFMECNHQPYDWFSYTIRVVLMVPILIFGFAANTMNCMIFRQERMRTSMVNWYLVALSITDIGVLFSSFCMLSLPVICEDFDSLILFNLGVNAQRWTYALGLIMQTGSVGMTVLVSSHRFLGVVFPFRAQQYCTARRVKVAMWSVAVFAVAFNLPRWFEIDVDACHSGVYNATATRLVLSNLRLDNLYYSAYMVILYTLFMFAFPFLLLIIMNALIVRTVHRSYRLRQMLTNKVSNTGTTAVSAADHRQKVSQPIKLPASPSPNKRQEQYELRGAHNQTNAAEGTTTAASSSSTATATSSLRENKTTIMLIAVVFMFLLCNSLAFINNILEVLEAHGVPVLDAYLTSVELSNFLVVINSASNIFIYWTFSHRYRILFRRYTSYACWCLGPLCSSLGISRRPGGGVGGGGSRGSKKRSAVVVAIPVQGRSGKNSPPNRLLMIRKSNDDNHDVILSKDQRQFQHQAAIDLVNLRQNGFLKSNTTAVETASITRRASSPHGATTASATNVPGRSARFRNTQYEHSQPREDTLLDQGASSRYSSSSDGERLKPSIVSSV